MKFKKKDTKNLSVILYLLIVIFIISCKGLSDKENSKIGNCEYVILKVNETNGIFEDSNPTELTWDEIVEIEKIIKPKISKVISYHNKYLKKKDIYSRQYVATIDKNGDKLVWIQFICDDISETEWKTKIIYVADGGDCVFSLKVNLKEKKYYDFNQNFES